MPATKSLSFGYHRAEVVGTLVSIIFIWGLTIWLLYEATLRILAPQEVLGGTMLIVAIMGLIFNLIQMKILHSGDGHYHLGGSHDHDHDGHDHDHGHSHGHKLKKEHSHKQDHGVTNHELKEPLIDQEEHKAQEHKHTHEHNHDHEHGHKCKHNSPEG